MRSDFNGDGVEDLAVGIPQRVVVHGSETWQRTTGAVQVFYGSASGVSTTTQLLHPGRRLPYDPCCTIGGLVGTALAAGDFDGDGYSDLAIGAPTYGNDEAQPGQVLMMYGSSRGLRAKHATAITFLQSVDSNYGNYLMGRALAAGDFDADGTDDLAVAGVLYTTEEPDGPGAPYARGIVYALRGGQRGLRSVTDGGGDVIAQGGKVGSALTTGDFNADGAAELAAGDPARTVEGRARAGAVVLVTGAKGSGLDPRTATDVTATTLRRTPGEHDRVGSALAAGDFDANAAADLIVSIRDPRDGGHAYVIPGDVDGLRYDESQHWSEGARGVTGTPTAGDRFAASIATGDLNRDGADDVAFGVPGKLEGRGVVHVVYGQPGSGLPNSAATRGATTQRWHQDRRGIPGTAEAGDRFGAAVTMANLGRGRWGDLIVGVPGEDFTRKPDAGMVNVLYGTDTKVRARGAQAWHPGVDGVSGRLAPREGFGAALVGSPWDCAAACPPPR